MQETDEQYPQFELANTRVKSGQKQIRSHMTQAYEIQCKRGDSTKVMNLLKTGKFRQTMEFVPYAYKKHKPTAFLQAIQNQNKCLTDTWIIKISGFTNEAIEHCGPAILEHKGALEIVPSTNSQINGDWKILASRKKISQYYNWLKAEMPRIISTIPNNITAPENYPTYQINSHPPSTYQDADQEDEDSYATMFSNAMTNNTNQSPTTYEIPAELKSRIHSPTNQQRRLLRRYLRRKQIRKSNTYIHPKS
jgi:hypothetical protein